MSTNPRGSCLLHQRYKSVRKGRPQRAPSSGPRPVSTSSHCPQTSLISEGMSRNCFQIGNPFLKAPRAQLGPAQAIPVSTLPPGGASGCGCPHMSKLSSGLFCSWSTCPGRARGSAGHLGVKKQHPVPENSTRVSHILFRGPLATWAQVHCSSHHPMLQSYKCVCTVTAVGVRTAMRPSEYQPSHAGCT